MPRTRLARLVTLVVALVQLVAPALASVADARLERESARSPQATGHVESHGSPSCPRVHPADCALCQVIDATASPTPSRDAVPCAGADLAVAVEALAGFATESGYRPALPRAPPAV